MDAARTRALAALVLGVGFWALGVAVTGAQDPPVGNAKERVRAALRIAEFDLALREATALTDVAAPDAEALALLGDARWGTGLFDEADDAYARARAADSALVRAGFG